MKVYAPEIHEFQAEVSGWDSAENFFVEKTRLCWGREGKNEIVLQRNVRVGSVVFVRLLRELADPVDFPIAYRVDQAQELSGADVQVRVLLSRLHPKAPFRETVGLEPLASSFAA